MRSNQNLRAAKNSLYRGRRVERGTQLVGATSEHLVLSPLRARSITTPNHLLTNGHFPLFESRSKSVISTARPSSFNQPRPAKSASALLTVSRDAPTSWANSS